MGRGKSGFCHWWLDLWGGYWLQVFRCKTCRNVVLHNQMIINLPFTVHLLTGLKGIYLCTSGSVMAFCCFCFSTSFATITKYPHVCYVFILCTLHPPCLCCSVILWLGSLIQGDDGQKQREPSPLANSEIARYSVWCSAPCPKGAVFHFLHRTSKMLAGRKDYED